MSDLRFQKAQRIKADSTRRNIISKIGLEWFCATQDDQRKLVKCQIVQRQRLLQAVIYYTN